MIFRKWKTYIYILLYSVAAVVNVNMLGSAVKPVFTGVTATVDQWV